jgi:DNA repair exonuclease SbcCD ATPase subunit
MSDNSSIMSIADFNITEMSADTMSALSTHQKIITAEQTAANAMISLCENLKLMRDKHLYEALGFETFDTYTEQACGIKRRQAYNYISTYEKLGSTVLQSNAQLGITKLQLLTEVCAVDRDDFIADNDLAGMSVKEIKELVEKSKQQCEQLALLGDELNDSNNVQKSLQSDKQKLTDENKSLQKRIKELEDKPVEVAVQEPTQAQIEAAAQAKINSLKSSFEKEKQNAVEQAVRQATEKAQTSVKDELEKTYRAKLEAIDKEKADAIKKAEQLANKLDKNADADLVTATLYFNELQAQLAKFINSVEKIVETNPTKGEKLKQIAKTFLSDTIANLN